jgi:hypothetical protein
LQDLAGLIFQATCAITRPSQQIARLGLSHFACALTRHYDTSREHAAKLPVANSPLELQGSAYVRCRGFKLRESGMERNQRYLVINDESNHDPKSNTEERQCL